MDRRSLIEAALELAEAWEGRWGAFERSAATEVEDGRLRAAWDAYADRMDANPPFFHPRYAGQMLKPPHAVAVAAYAAAMIVNPNNHALESSPATSVMEREVVADLAGMLGLPRSALGHLTGGGTMANLEALWVARELHPGRAVVHSADAHYTHGRMCQVLGVEARAVPASPEGRIDLDAVEAQCRRGDVGTVVLTAGTTGLGAVDRIDEALTLRERYGVRLHVDAAYGGFFALLAGSGLVPAAPFAAVAHADSVVVDPHKHGLQPYGCGAVLFRDPSVGRLYRHDSPYTYFTSDQLHLGEISLECSRPGAAAGALWLTLRALPLRAGEGLGPVLAGGLRAARDWAARLERSDALELHVQPELDIVTYWAADPQRSMRRVDGASERILQAAMADPHDPVFLSMLRVGAGAFVARHAGYARDVDSVRVLRSVLMKPEHEAAVGWLHERVEALAG